jgi:hypothetical protein
LAHCLHRYLKQTTKLLIFFQTAKTNLELAALLRPLLRLCMNAGAESVFKQTPNPFSGDNDNYRLTVYAVTPKGVP